MLSRYSNHQIKSKTSLHHKIYLLCIKKKFKKIKKKKIKKKRMKIKSIVNHKIDTFA